MDSVLEIAHKYLSKVRRTGPDNIMALCPFHDNQNSPAFTMSLSRGLYYCFSCDARGNLSMFLRNMGVSRTAIGTQYGFVLEQLSSHRPKKAQPLQTPKDNSPLPESLLGIFDKCPLALIDEDGFDEGLLQKLDIGFDDKHMRITFPLRDIEGNLVGISGRTVVDESPKYKVYDVEYKNFELPTHRTFKNHLLWNGHLVYPETYFTKGSYVVGVEGFKACMRFLQAGIPNTVAMIGAFMSKYQRQLIERMAEEFYIMLDENDAGLKGTVHAGMTLGIPVRVIPYLTDKIGGDKGLQPSDLEPDELALALCSAKDFYTWLNETPEAMVIYRERQERKRKYPEDWSDSDP